MSNDRSADLAYLQQAYRNAPPEKRREIAHTALKIANESQKVKDMRQQLIKNIREGKADNVKDIHEYVKKNSNYQNG